VNLTIRTRLTFWYSSILLIALIAFSLAVYFTFRTALQASIDIDLAVRLVGVAAFMRREMPRFPRGRLWHEFDENVQLRPGGEMLQISDREGAWVFQSQSMHSLGLGQLGGAPADDFTTQLLRGVPVRMRTAIIEVQGQPYSVQLATPLGPPYAALQQFVHAMFVFIPLFLLAASTGGYWLSRRALAPVDRIIQQSQTIGHHNLSERLTTPRSGDELQRLSETLNEMIARLEGAFKRVTQFTADASHELRSPVAFIRTTAEFTLLQVREPEMYQVAMNNVLVEAEGMTTLLNDLLTLARADSSTSQLTLTSIDVREPLCHAGHHAATYANGKNVNFFSDIPNVAVNVLGDAAALHRLFVILIENAIRYTPAGGRVAVKLAISQTEALISVQDSGIGIADEEIPRIFERFYRSDKARQRDSGGTGLGLSIAHWIAEAHRTRIQVKSQPGMGSDFSVRLALAK
jgi:heavy metal sensor kinase